VRSRIARIENAEEILGRGSLRVRYYTGAHAKDAPRTPVPDQEPADPRDVVVLLPVELRGI